MTIITFAIVVLVATALIIVGFLGAATVAHYVAEKATAKMDPTKTAVTFTWFGMPVIVNRRGMVYNFIFEIVFKGVFNLFVFLISNPKKLTVNIHRTAGVY